MDIEYQNLIKKMADEFIISDKESAQVMLRLIFSKEKKSKIQRLAKELFTKPALSIVLEQLLDQGFLGRDIEWALVIPLENYMNNAKDLYEIIFGIGQEISDRDLFLIWDGRCEKISILNLKFDENRTDIMSLYELHNLATHYEEHPKKRPIRYITIEYIKECLATLQKSNHRIIKACKKEKFLLKPEHLTTDLRHLNVISNILGEATLIFLKDVFDTRHNIKQEKGKASFTYDPYSMLRKLLRLIQLYAETRGGSRKRPGRIPNDVLRDIKKYLLDECSHLGVKGPAKKLVKEIFIRESGQVPSEVLVKKIKKEISAKLNKSTKA